MSDNQKESIIAKIRKSLALAADPNASEGEAATAARMASRLMMMHDIAEYEVSATNSGKIRCGFAFARHMGEGKNAPIGFQFIAVGVAEFIGCIATHVFKPNPTTGEIQQQFRFAGEINDVKFAVWLCETLNAQALREFKAYKGSEHKFAWLNGFGAAVQLRLRAMAKVKQETQAEIAESDSRALVVIDKKAAAIAEKFEPVEYSTKKAAMGRDGYAAGESTVIPTGAIEQQKPNVMLN